MPYVKTQCFYFLCSMKWILGYPPKSCPPSFPWADSLFPVLAKRKQGRLFVNLGNVERTGFPVGAVGEGQSPAR